MRLMLKELVGNAWKVTSRREAAWIRIGAGDPLAEDPSTLVVSDNGAGFDIAQAGKLFTAFHRLHSSREFPGAGIGLAVVRQVVHRHGGGIRVLSANGQGASFGVTLP